MPVFQSRRPDIQTIGQTLLAVVDGMGVFKATALKWLKEVGIEDPKPDQWYSLQAWLDVFKRIYDKLGEATLKHIGSKWPANVIFPPEIKSVEHVLEILDNIYSMNQKGGADPGRYIWEKTGDRKGILTTNHPFPCALDHGVIEGFVNKFKKPGDTTSVNHLTGCCKMDSGDICKFEVKW